MAKARTSCECIRFEAVCVHWEVGGLVWDVGLAILIKENWTVFWSTPEVYSVLPS
jgi:hypothetical protein